jgi:ATP-dependent protease ClpP protease subunit
MNIEKLLNPSSNDVWSNYVPIISDKNHTTAYLTNTIEEPSEYNELCFRLKSASPAEIFTLVINTPGGILDSALMLVDAIKTSKAKVIAQISGTVASAGTIITLACDKVEVAPHTAFMIHNYSGGLVGKGHELKAHQEFVDANLNNSFTDLYRGFLTPSEIKKVIDGKDYWMNRDEVLERLLARSTTTVDALVETSDTVKPKRGRPAKA